ncbi:MAG: zinc ribbon domain-containing protein [Deferribacteraceae bacterium]|jgi:putative FmdB family regulatory protein|nr:zinc ribbon domain-containing protein [Deferribacteraceae bacterium]
MPIYEYVCKECGKKIEKLVTSISGADSIPCSCGGTADKILSLSSFQLKGSGWYRSDYKKEPKQETCPAKTDSPSCNACPHSAAQ